MKRASKKQREIRFHSGKCGRIICVNSYAEQEYAKKLEADDRVENYEENAYWDFAHAVLYASIPARDSHPDSAPTARHSPIQSA